MGNKVPVLQLDSRFDNVAAASRFIRFLENTKKYQQWNPQSRHPKLGMPRDWDKRAAAIEQEFKRRDEALIPRVCAQLQQWTQADQDASEKLEEERRKAALQFEFEFERGPGGMPFAALPGAPGGGGRPQPRRGGRDRGGQRRNPLECENPIVEGLFRAKLAQSLKPRKLSFEELIGELPPRELFGEAERNPVFAQRGMGTFFKNQFPDEPAPLHTKIVLPSSFLKVRGAVSYDYVVTITGGLVIGQREAGQGHANLAEGRPVLAAGNVRVSGGRIIEIDNASGHYLPTGRFARIAAINAFRTAGFAVGEKDYVEKAFNFDTNNWEPVNAN